MAARYLLVLSSILAINSGQAQSNGYNATKLDSIDFHINIYEKDSSARAVILHEFGEAYIDSETFTLIFEHHLKIKILKKEGLDKGDFVILLFKSSSKSEKLRSFNAAIYNMMNEQISETRFKIDQVFTERVNDNWIAKKISLPNVKEGSIIKISYEIESPFIYKFRNFEFQTDIPKVVSEFWAKIPANLVYNITLKGFQQYSKTENLIIRNCIKSGDVGYGGNGYAADCVLHKFKMENVPALYEEDYMTAKKNFISAINFELSEIKYFDGRVDKITKSWKDVEIELKKEEKFGGQLRKGKEIEEKISTLINETTDPTERAKKVYSFIQRWFKWNEKNDFFCESGVNKSFSVRSGNVADINFSLIVALNHAGIKAEPVLLSTRSNGLVTEHHPVLSDFNYIVARVTIGENIYLLDATDQYLPFGMLPEKCLNGKGRVFSPKGSFWQDLNPSEKYKRVTVLNLILQPNGAFKGTVEDKRSGYDAFEKRKQILSYTHQDEYIEDFKKRLSETTLSNFQIIGLNDLNEPLIEKYEIEIEGYNGLQNNILLNPFFVEKIDNNPFRSNQRLFPVDFGAPLEKSIMVNLTYPATIELSSAPEKTEFKIPNEGGKFHFGYTSSENKLSIDYQFSINKTVFTSSEYESLKEFFNKVIETQQTDFLFKKK